MIITCINKNNKKGNWMPNLENWDGTCNIVRKCMFFNDSTCLLYNQQGFIQGGGALGFPPPQVECPPRI